MYTVEVCVLVSMFLEDMCSSVRIQLKQICFSEVCVLVSVHTLVRQYVKLQTFFVSGVCSFFCQIESFLRD